MNDRNEILASRIRWRDRALAAEAERDKLREALKQLERGASDPYIAGNFGWVRDIARAALGENP